MVQQRSNRRADMSLSPAPEVQSSEIPPHPIQIIPRVELEQQSPSPGAFSQLHHTRVRIALGATGIDTIRHQLTFHLHWILHHARPSSENVATIGDDVPIFVPRSNCRHGYPRRDAP